MSREQAGLIQPGPKIRWNTGCTFVDYDRTGTWICLSRTMSISI